MSNKISLGVRMQPLIRPCFERIYDCISQPIFSDAPARPKEETQSISSSARMRSPSAVSLCATKPFANIGGRGGIRTPGGVAPTQPFQGCTIDHSDTLPVVVLFACRAGARSGTRTRTYSRIADFESAAAAITPPWPCPVWSGRRESNPRSQLGRLELCH